MSSENSRYFPLIVIENLPETAETLLLFTCKSFSVVLEETRVPSVNTIFAPDVSEVFGLASFET
ncbi:hypothetical protein D3C86_2133560 [compost metagenome]